MRGLLVLLVLLLLGVGTLGYYQGWFKVSKAQTEQGPSYQVTVDKEKIKADQERAKEKAQGVADQFKEKAKGITGPARKEAAARESRDGRE